MKMIPSLKKATFSLTLLLAIAMLPGCDLFKEQKEPVTIGKGPSSLAVNDGSEVLLKMDTTVNGKIQPQTAVATQKSFLGDNGYVAKLEEAQPGLSAMLDVIPGALRQFFKNMQDELTVAEWARREKLHERPEYIKRREEYIEMIDRGLPVQFFEQDIATSVKVNDKDAEKYYNDNKATDPMFQNRAFLQEPAGVVAQGVLFPTEKEAQDFYEKIQAAGTSAGSLFAQNAKDAGKTITDFGSVTVQSTNVEPAVASKIATTQTVPSVFVVKGDKGVWVVKALSKKAAVYAPFEQIKDRVIEMLSRKELGDILGKKLEALKQEYNQWINEEFFAKKGNNQQADMPEMSEEEAQQMMQEMEAASARAA